MRVVFFFVYFILPVVPLPIVALVPRIWPLVALLGVAIVTAYGSWLHLTEFDSNEPILLFDQGFLLLWFVATLVGYRIGQRRSRRLSR